MAICNSYRMLNGRNTSCYVPYQLLTHYLLYLSFYGGVSQNIDTVPFQRRRIIPQEYVLFVYRFESAETPYFCLPHYCRDRHIRPAA